MKSITGYLGYDEKRKKWFGRVTFTDPRTGRRKYRKCYALTKTDARRKLEDLKEKLRNKGPHAAARELTTFADLARAYKDEKLVPAVYVGERKIADRRELSAPGAWLMQLRYHFGRMRLESITRGEIEKFKVWLSHLPTRSVIEESIGGNQLILIRNEKGGRRSVEAVNRPVELLRTMLSYAVDEKMLRPDQSPFADRKTRSLIERSGEKKRERIPGFGEEMALLDACVEDRAHLRAVIIIASDTGLRQNELFTLSWREKDIDFERRQIRVRAINAKTNMARVIPMTWRVYGELAQLRERDGEHQTGLIFGGLREPKRSFNTACRVKGINDLRKHDLRHAFITRAILAGIPPAVVLKASGHSSDEWKRYLNVTPDVLQGLFCPLQGQDAVAVRAYGLEVMRQLKQALGIFWNASRSPERLFGELVDAVMRQGS